MRLRRSRHGHRRRRHANCHDGCPNDPLKIAPGQCGCGAPDTDTDGDGTADCVDGCPNDPLKTAPGSAVAARPTPTATGTAPRTATTDVRTTRTRSIPDLRLRRPGHGQRRRRHAELPRRLPERPVEDRSGRLRLRRRGHRLGRRRRLRLRRDKCPNDPNKIAPGICGAASRTRTTDGDTVPDCIDNCIHDPEPRPG
jgi:hypothetical protein